MSTLSNELNENGYPKNPNSISIAIQRKLLPHLDEFRKRLGDPNGRIGIPVRLCGEWLTLHGHVTEIQEFADGVVIHYPQVPRESFLSWAKAILWVPNTGMIGVLNPQPISDEEIQAHIDEMHQKHMEDSSQLAYLLDWIFKYDNELLDGTTKEQVGAMTQFKQIELLERINENPVLISKTQVKAWEIEHFVRDVNKSGFRTADDFEPAVQ